MLEAPKQKAPVSRFLVSGTPPFPPPMSGTPPSPNPNVGQAVPNVGQAVTATAFARGHQNQSQAVTAIALTLGLHARGAGVRSDMVRYMHLHVLCVG